MKIQSQRQRRMGEQIRHILIEAIQRGHFMDSDTGDLSNVTVAEVRPSPDLKQATVYVMTLQGQGVEQSVDALNKAHGFYQSYLAKQLTSKFTPRLKFVKDESFEAVNRLEAIIHNLPKAADTDNG